MGPSDIEQGLALGIVQRQREATLSGLGLELTNAPAGIDSQRCSVFQWNVRVVSLPGGR